VGVGLSGGFDLGGSLGTPLAETEFETAFMNIVWHLLIVESVLIAVTIILLIRFEQRRWDEERKQELQDFDQ
jgi:Na+/H+ antiporter NhaD/arsenite permease-like protein